ncbi:hypothetical protein KDW_58770 [Dictyobacter vulcani]|uniref:Phosphoenolpyruvate synthase n=1 Tax=Dictyobacter vulcani TaxID=2607529 RepID=A0A5J4KUV5_9CHLR|nr:hypothetical protein KDW_58770 [Dictyobacter vulcani]
MRGPAMVLDAVKRCWASLWTARAIDYRARHHIASEDVSLAVVVQELVAADAAGILFTADPVTGSSNQVVINAAWGLARRSWGDWSRRIRLWWRRPVGRFSSRRLRPRM